MPRPISRRAAPAAAFAAALLCGAFQPAAAGGKPPADMKPETLISQALMDELREVIRNEIVQITVRAQNERHDDVRQDDIDGLDKQWVAERKADDKPLISATLSNPLSVYLLRMQARSSGLYSEIFIMDEHGLNVGQSSITTDYWQGDEAKYKQTFLVAPDAVFIDDPAWHEETRTWRAQVNMTIPDTESGAGIGAAVFEINLTELKRRLGS